MPIDCRLMYKTSIQLTLAGTSIDPVLTLAGKQLTVCLLVYIHIILCSIYTTVYYVVYTHILHNMLLDMLHDMMCIYHIIYYKYTSNINDLPRATHILHNIYYANTAVILFIIYC